MVNKELRDFLVEVSSKIQQEANKSWKYHNEVDCTQAQGIAIGLEDAISIINKLYQEKGRDTNE